MTTTEPAANTTRCSECRRHSVRIVRVHRGERFCQARYKRLFKRRLCPQCGNFARLPRLERNAICLTCENARPCVRWGENRCPGWHADALRPGLHRLHALLQAARAVRALRDAVEMALAEKGTGARPAPLSPVLASWPRDLRSLPAASSAGNSAGRAQALPCVHGAVSAVARKSVILDGTVDHNM